LPCLNSRETARLFQWSAPGRVLGEYPDEPRLRRELLMAVTEGDLAAETNDVDICLQEHFEVRQQMTFLPSDAEVKPIEFWLDLPGAPGWSRFGRAGSSLCFLVHENVAIAREP
jgi:hypothetical protein